MSSFPSSDGNACASCCATGTAPIPSRFCAGSNHYICDPCFATILDENPFLPPACPVREDVSRICGRMILDMNQLSFPVYIDIYLNQFNFPCSFANYGCPFVGNGTEVLKHFAGGCVFSPLSVCNVKSKNGKDECRLLFIDSPLRKIKHMRGVHGIESGRVERHAVEIVMSEGDCRLEENWHPIQIQMLDYPDDRFCMMFIYENKEEVRIWLCELDPGKMGVESGARFEVTISGSSKTRGNQYFGYQSRVIPCMLKGLLVEGDKYWRRCFNIEKKFLRQIASKGGDEKMRFKLKITFLNEDTTPISSDEDGGGVIMEQKGNRAGANQSAIMDVPGTLPVSMGLEKTGVEPVKEAQQSIALETMEPSSLKGDGHPQGNQVGQMKVCK